MKTIITEGMKGLLIKNGKYVRTLHPGKYHTFGDTKILLCHQNAGGQFICNENWNGPMTMDRLLTLAAQMDDVFIEEVKEGEIALHFVDGKYHGAYTARTPFWKEGYAHSFIHIPADAVEIDPAIPHSVCVASPAFCHRFTIEAYEKGLLMVNGAFRRVLEPGVHYFWNRRENQIEVRLTDMRLKKLDIAGQEMLTMDKVPVRVNFVCTYRVADCVKIHTEVEDVEEHIHVAAQLALRTFVGKYRLDELLENKDALTQSVFDALREKAPSLFVTFTDAGVKDIILPGEIRSIMNTVLAAEKRAQANVITRREEIASTRSLLNTAKLMDENRTLYKLKELEYLERICEHVGTITVDGRDGVLEALATVVGGKRDEQA